MFRTRASLQLINHFFMGLLLLVAADSWAQEKRANYFDLPALPLNQALIEFALQSGLSIAVNDEWVRGQQSVPLVGPFYPDKALNLLIAKANLVAEYDQQQDSFVLIQKPLPTLAPATEPEHAQDVEEVVVTGRLIPSRYPNAVNSFVREGVSQFDSVRFHQFVSQSLMHDMAAQSVSEALTQSSGMTPGDGLGNSNDDFFLRGFPRHGIYRDNFKYSDQTAIKIAPETIDSLQLVKGPASLFYGQSDAGGVVNATTKQPQETASLSPSIVVGENGIERASIDWNLPATEHFYTRFIGVYENEQDSINTQGERITLLPAVKFILPSQISLDLSYEYQQLLLNPNRDYLILRNYENVLAPRTLAQSVNYAQPDFAATSGLMSMALHVPLANGWRMQSSFDWQDEERLGIRQSLWSFTYADSLLPVNNVEGDDVFLNLAGQISVPLEVRGTAVRFGPVVRLYDEQTYDTIYSAAWGVNGQWRRGGIDHRLALGIDSYRLDRYYEAATETRTPLERRFLEEDNFLMTLQAQTDYLLATEGPLGSIYRAGQRIVSDEFGAYSHWHARWNQWWSSSLGVRLSDISGYLQKGQAPTRTLNGTNDALVQVGLTFQPTESFSLFTNYSESLLANVSFEAVLASPLTPQKANQRELGAKYLGLGGRLNASAALFDAYKQDLPILLLSQQKKQVSYYDQRVVGAEFDLSFEINRDTQIITHGSLMDPRIEGGDYDGNYAPLAADITLGGFVRQRFTRQWAASIGARYVSERSGDLANQIVIDSFTVGDMHIQFEADNWDAQLSVKNFTDERYIIAVVPGSHEYFADGRTVQLQMRYHWDN